MAASAALISSAALSVADETGADSGVTIKINGETVNTGQIEKMANEAAKFAQGKSPEELQEFLEMAMKSGAGEIVDSDMSIKLNGMEIDVSQIEGIVSGVLNNLSSTSLEDMKSMIEQIIGSGQIEEILKSLTVDSKAFIVGPDGKTHELEVNLDKLPIQGGILEMFSMPLAAKSEPYYVGVEVENVPDMLRAHIGGLEDGGVLVNSVFDGSPAKSAGIQSNDIILKISGEKVNDREALVRIVQKAGQEKTEMSVELIRKGESMTLSVPVAKREMPPVVSSMFLPKMELGESLIDASDVEGLRKEVQANRELMNQILEQLKQLNGAK